MKKALRWDNLLDGLLIILILLGIGLRFSGLDWNQGTNLHPDEYGMTNTLTQLKLPVSLENYFNTRISSLSPYMRYDANGNKLNDGPDNRMRWGQWPLTILRAAAEWSGNTGYDELRVMGRQLSASADTLTVLILFFLGRRLYGYRVGLLAAALSALAVLQIQQAHFMTVDTFAVLFSISAMYAAVRIAQEPLMVRSKAGIFRANWRVLGWFIGFGAAFGMAVASKVNLAPLAGMVVLAALISAADLRLREQRDLRRILFTALIFLMVSGFASLAVFRLTQPMSFRASQGDTTWFSLQLNSDWLESMQVAQGESSGVGGGPPGEQWTARMPLIFPWINLAVWGMGVPLGLAAWLSFGWAAGEWLISGKGWRSHLLVLVWTGGYFLFMGTRWVTSLRYFLPIYPFLCLLAAWGLLKIWQDSRHTPVVEDRPRQPQLGNWNWRKLTGRLMGGIVLIGTCIWALSFMNAVYWTEHTRLQATQWIFQNIPAPFHLTLHTAEGKDVFIPVSGMDGLKLTAKTPFVQTFQAPEAGSITELRIPHVSAGGKEGRLQLTILTEGSAALVLGEGTGSIPVGNRVPGELLRVQLRSQPLEAGRTYAFMVSIPAGAPDIQINRSVIANESWDEGLPVPFEGRDPFGQLYRGLTMQVRWLDDANKRQMFLDTLAQTDYIVVPSQRAVWATCRLPDMYPMTMAYYRALFGGQLGFSQVASFSAPLQIGPLYVSDLAGSAAWGKAPDLPLFNHSLMAAEEAFSVYDHPPVWIFQKQSGFNLQMVQQILDQIDLSQVKAQSPRDATGRPCQ